jgi:uncharacterized protein YgiM (DUF1202 family)
MKTNVCLLLGTLLATAAVAQVNTNKLPEIPAPATAAPVIAPAAVVVPATNAPVTAKKKAVVHKKKAAPLPKLTEPSVTLNPGPATVGSDNLNLRGQAGLKGEVVGHLKKGDAVTVISQINLDKHAAGEPAQWAKVLLPGDTKGWINAHFVDASNNVVSSKKLNLRAGPSENYSVIGLLQKGETFTPLTVKGDWIEIEAPKTAFAFVAAMYLKQEAAPAPVVTEPPAAPVTTNIVAEAAPIVTTPPAPEPTPAPTPAPATAIVDTNTPAAAVVDTNLPPPPPRVVTHEGYVRHSTSIVAPTAYELYDPTSGNAINYLLSSTTNLDISRYSGLQIVVTGEEGMHERWADTPVITVQKIYVLSTNKPASDNKRAVSPRERSNEPLRSPHSH